MDLAKQLASSGKTVREGFLREWKEFKSKSKLTQSKREDVVPMLTTNEKSFKIIADEIMDLD